MNSTSPFLEVRSFVSEAEEAPEAAETLTAPVTPFLSLYESEDGEGLVDPVGEEYVQFLNELHDEELEEALFALTSEASSLYEARFAGEDEDARTTGSYEAERMLDQYFAPLLAETRTMLETIAGELGNRETQTLTAEEVEAAVERYQPSSDVSPNFEEFLNKLKRVVKKVASKAVSLAKKGLSVVSKLGLGPILEKLKALVKPLLKRVIQTAIGKLPYQLQPIARKLAERVPFLRETEETLESLTEPQETSEVAEIQLEFNRQIANLLFAENEAQLQLETAEAQSEEHRSEAHPLAELDRARDQFVQNLAALQEGEDPTPHIQQFLPAILPALKVGINLIGRKRVVDFLAKLLAKLLHKFIGPQFAPALSQAIVDAGLRLIHLEATEQEVSRAAPSAVAATVEETVRRVAALPDYVLDNQELLEGYALEAFEQAAASNLPQVLPQEAYRKRPDLTEARKLCGAWIQMPRGRRKRYKKFTRKIPITLVPHKAAAVESFAAVQLDEFLEEGLGIAAGEEVEAVVHLYETLPGTNLAEIARLETETPGLGTPASYEQFHPLTPEAAATLIGEPELGRETPAEGGAGPYTSAAGQRLYYLEIPGRRPLTAPGAPGRAPTRRTTQVRLTLDFPKNEIRIYFFLSELRAQQIAVKLRQHAHVGTVAVRLRRFLERGLGSALSGRFGRLKLVHEAVTPDRWASAMRRLPSLVPQLMLRRLQEWAMKALVENLKQRSAQFVKAAEDTADGVTILITIANPPALAEVRKALKGQALSLAALKTLNVSPAVSVTFSSGYTHE